MTEQVIISYYRSYLDIMGQDSSRHVIGGRIPKHPRFDKAQLVTDSKGITLIQTTKVVM